jgi:hypothetical protein
MGDNSSVNTSSKYANFNTTVTGTGCSQSYINLSYSTTSTTASNYVPLLIERHLLVEHPKNWTREQNIAWCKLVNNTHCGFRVELYIHGEVDIIDPHVEKRSFNDFVELLLIRAGSFVVEDKVNKFLKENPIE